MAETTIRLEAAGWQCEIAPARGGAILNLSYRDDAVLRPSPSDAVHPFQLASFVMAPYANRIANGRFAWDGEEVVLPANIEGERHPLHGVGFAASWAVLETSEAAATLALVHTPSQAWPWACTIRQRIEVSGAGFLHVAELTNADVRGMPAGLGFHPYFTPATGARLRTDVEGRWTADAEQLPVQFEHQPDAWRGVPVRAAELMDHCFSGWSRSARIDWPARSLSVTASTDLNHLHVYAPPEADFFCIEPVSHRPNHVTSMRRLAPSETMAAWMRLAMVEAVS